MDTSWDNIAYTDVLRELGGGRFKKLFIFSGLFIFIPQAFSA
jgi:hypothetical protein